MKKLFKLFTPATLMLVLTMAFMVSACSSDTTGDRLYMLYCGDDASGEMTCAMSGAEDKIITEILKVAKQYTSSTYIMNGKFNDCDNAMKAAVDRAMSAIEAEDGYNSFFLLKGIPVSIKVPTSVEEGGVPEVVYTRTFK